jgi:hypothetical protein
MASHQSPRAFSSNTQIAQSVLVNLKNVSVIILFAIVNLNNYCTENNWTSFGEDITKKGVKLY